ncbi:sigma-54-dependent Fis family transcriptional re gulator [Desulfonema ishimotonii]|uniref:Sigma-54-dependent Fis family transcriptional re gulator n=1 Tax=Desulfonema ishimotonii TaxID=45657 RepID=A0A401G3U9_9BACT|nr:sigma 54-interacting transcriptional regulator [Desulfonema ishimotonii]GBC63894.1 sigma-54-dependent Fis family transcriptional re gulator [Desulfonema ishimotonii]
MVTRLLPQIQGLFSPTIDLKPLLDEIPVGLLLLDTRRRGILVNRSLQALTGLSPENVAGIPCYHLLRSRICVTRCPALGMLPDDEAVCTESDLISRDRNLIPIRMTLGPLKGPDGRIVGFLESVEDLRPIREIDARVHQAYRFADIIGRSPRMERLFKMLPVIAQSDSSVLITGETGTGKDMVAEAVHRASERSGGPFIKVNCGALPETLLESELFGHQKGAFTGAVENKPGRFRLAHNGTLFLTEIGDLPLSLQVKLLTFLDDKIVYPLGSTKGFQANVRVIAATHRDLAGMVREQRFRGDLLFRLNVVRLHLPPLRERGADIRLLLDHFLNTFAPHFRKNIKGFSPKSLAILQQYPYPGNVRELRNIVEYAVNFCDDGIIHRLHLPAYITETGTAEPFPSPEPVPFMQMGAATEVVPPRAVTETRTWEAVERQMIMDALVKTGGRRSRAAHLLGWGRSTLWRKMKHHGIDGS